MQKGMSKKDKK